ncbi:MAG: CPBP family intramembrane metalloprotease [Akkermansiaceae bacterium]|nr:CPBP family intramembrane metalloprotease [Akkermansiaceae bacterium]
MSDPTEPAIIATFSVALGIFAITATTRRQLGKNELPVIEPTIIPEMMDDSPYAAPQSAPASIPLPQKGVPTWFYNPLDLLGLGCIFLIFSGLIIGSLRMAEKAEKVMDANGLIGSIIFQLIIAGIATSFVISRVRPVEWLGLKWQRWPQVFLIAPPAVFLMWIVLGSLSALGYMQWIDSLGVDSMQDSVKLLQEAKDPVLLGLMAIAAVIAAPVCEEIVFRGYVYPAAKKFVGPWIAGLCSALVFSAAHGSLVALLPIFILGGLLAFIYEKTGSLWAPIAVHFCFNGATVAMQFAARFLNLPLDPPP